MMFKVNPSKLSSVIHMWYKIYLRFSKFCIWYILMIFYMVQCCLYQYVLILFTCIYNAFVLNTLFLLYIYVYKLYYEMWNTPKITINVWFWLLSECYIVFEFLYMYEYGTIFKSFDVSRLKKIMYERFIMTLCLYRIKQTKQCLVAPSLIRCPCIECPL